MLHTPPQGPRKFYVNPDVPKTTQMLLQPIQHTVHTEQLTRPKRPQEEGEAPNTLQAAWKRLRKDVYY